MLVMQEDGKLRSYGFALRRRCLIEELILHLLGQVVSDTDSLKMMAGISRSSTPMMQYKQRGQNPPDLTTAEGGTTISLWGLHYMQFWEVTMCQWQKRLDPAYNTYEVQNGNHIETFRLTFPQLELIQPHAQHAFDLLISAIENYAELPPSQCIPRGSTIDKNPPQPGHCTNLLVP